MTDQWVVVAVRYDGTVHLANDWLGEVEHDRTVDNHWWKNIVNLPSLVVIEWKMTPTRPNLNQFFIYVKL